MGETQIAPDKIRAYLATHYRIDCEDPPIELTVGARSDSLAVLFTDRGVACGAFITAFNPRGTVQADAANHLAHARLAEALAQHDVEIIEGAGGADRSDWPPECSWFAPGLPLDAARTIGLRFDQDAIVWSGSVRFRSW